MDRFFRFKVRSWHGECRDQVRLGEMSGICRGQRMGSRSLLFLSPLFDQVSVSFPHRGTRPMRALQTWNVRRVDLNLMALWDNLSRQRQLPRNHRFEICRDLRLESLGSESLGLLTRALLGKL